MPQKKVRLTVKAGSDDDAYNDIARINSRDRGGDVGSGRICKLSVNGQSKYFIVRDLSDHAGVVRVDAQSREALNIRLGQEYNFRIERRGRSARCVGRALPLIQRRESRLGSACGPLS
jgi:hypothetical protein